MSAGLSLLGNLEPQQPTTAPLTSVPSTPGERMDASWQAAQSPDRYWNVQAARRDKAQKIIDDYHSLTGEKLRNPFDNAPTVEEVRESLGQPTTAIYAKRLQTLKEKTAAARAGLPDLGGLPQNFLNVDDIDPEIGQEAGARRTHDERLSGTGNGIPAFAASAAGEIFSPHGIASAFLPVTRMPLVAAEMQGGRWLANISKEALFQGVTQAGVQVAGSAFDFNTRKTFGTEQTTEQLIEEIAAAGVGGFVLGGAFRGTHLAIRKLMGHGVEVPPAVRDAALAVESRDLYGSKNPLGVPAAAHEAKFDQAVGDIAMGRPVSVSDLPTSTIHDTVRNTHPDLMARYDQLAAVREDIRGQLAGTDESVATLKQKLDDVTSRIQEAPRTEVEAASLGREARFAQMIYDDAITRRAAIDTGTPQETTVSQSLREQLAATDIEMRDMLSDIRAAHKEAGDQMAQALGFSKEANIAEPKLSIEETARVRELQENLSDYQRLMGEAAPEDRPAWQSAIDSANAEIAEILGQDIARHPGVKKAIAAASEPTESAALSHVAPVEEPTAGRPTSEAASPQDKAMDTQIKQMLDAEDGSVPPSIRQAYERAAQDEKEANAAIGCVMSGGVL